MDNSYNQMINNQEPIKKPKKTINVSIQSKKYSGPINRILDKWEKNGLNASNEVSENILLVDKLNKSITFSNMFNIYELIEKMVGLYEDLDSQSAFMKIENILSQVITIDNSKLGSVLALLNEEYINSMNNKTSKLNNVTIQKEYEPESNNNCSNPTIDNKTKYNMGNNYIIDAPRRSSPQSANQNNMDNYNSQNNKNTYNNNQNNLNNHDGHTSANLIDDEVSIPIDFLSND